MTSFRGDALLEYFSGGFNGTGEDLLLVDGSIGQSAAPAFLERLADQGVPDALRAGHAALLATRGWEFQAPAEPTRQFKLN